MESEDQSETAADTSHSSLLNPAQLRVVSVASLAHRNAEIFSDDLQAEHDYSTGSRYGQSKLANLLFTFELDRRLRVAGYSVRGSWPSLMAATSADVDSGDHIGPIR